MFRSPTRSGAGGAWKPSLEAVKYLLRETFDKSQLKMFTSSLRACMMNRASQDLTLLSSLNSYTSVCTFAPVKPDAEAFNPECGRSIIGNLTLHGCDGSDVTPDNQNENVFLYFTKASCKHCTAFTPKLKETFAPHNATVIVVSLDADPQALASTKQGCEGRWPILAPDQEANAAAISKLTDCYGVTGVPCVVSLRSVNNTWFIQNLNAVHTIIEGKPFPYIGDPRYLSLTETKVSYFYICVLILLMIYFLFQ